MVNDRKTSPCCVLMNMRKTDDRPMRRSFSVAQHKVMSPSFFLKKAGHWFGFGDRVRLILHDQALNVLNAFRSHQFYRSTITKRMNA